MSMIDIEKVINGTPQKVLINAYDKMKSNYTKESAEEYSSLYKDKSVDFILENSEYIFTEPYVGLEFYESIITDPTNCMFLRISPEFDKVSSYIKEHSDMPEAQLELYKNLSNKISTILEHTKNTRIYANYVKEHIDETFENKLSNAIYNNSLDEISSLFESASPITRCVYLPYVIEKVSDTSLDKYTESIIECFNINQDNARDKWTPFVEATICMNKLSNDSVYNEAISSFVNKDTRDTLIYLESVNLESVLNDFSTINVEKSEVVFHSTESAVNSLFDDIYSGLVFNEGVSDEFTDIEDMKAAIYEAELDIMLTEYQTANDLSDISSSYPFIESGKTIEESYNEIAGKLFEVKPEYMSESDDDVSDEEIDNIDNDEVPTGKKIKAPEPKNHAIAVQNKYMDKEAEQYKKRSIRKQKGQENKNAIKAVAALPKNVLDDMKKQAHQLDVADDERRKNYMTEPGFRKKWFRNLKLAILYGSAASVKLSLIPIVMTCRHFSKQKDERIRNELVRELETEIKVTEEKINDASANGDQKEKYRLMRIRDQLNTEMVRVRLNSKYV